MDISALLGITTGESMVYADSLEDTRLEINLVIFEDPPDKRDPAVSPKSNPNMIVSYCYMISTVVSSVNTIEVTPEAMPVQPAGIVP